MRISPLLCSLAATSVLAATCLVGVGPASAIGPTTGPIPGQPVHDPTPAPSATPTAAQPTPNTAELEPGELAPSDAESLAPPQAASAADIDKLTPAVTGEASTEVVWEGDLPAGLSSTQVMQKLEAGKYDAAGVAAEKAAAAAAAGQSAQSQPTTAAKKSKIKSHIRVTPVSKFTYSAGGINWTIPTGCYYYTNIKYNEVTSYVKEGVGLIYCVASVAKLNPNWCLTNQALRVYDASDKRVYRKYTSLDTRCHFGDGTATAHLTGIPYKWARYGKARMTFYAGHKARVWKNTPIHS